MLDGALTFIGLSGLVFLLYLWAGDLLQEHRSRRRSLLVLTVFVMSVLGSGLWFVGQAGYAGFWSGNRAALLGMSVLVSGLISLSWYLYLRRLDQVLHDAVAAGAAVHDVAASSRNFLFESHPEETHVEGLPRAWH